MSALRKQEQAVIEAVARHFSARWEEGDGDSPDTYLTLAGKRIAVAVTTIKRKIAARTKPRLRFDKAVLRLVGDLQAALSEFVPDGTVVVVTVTAPIRLASKTTAALEGLIRERLARRSASADIKDTINGNQVRVRFVQGISRRASKVIGFVHNPDPDAGVLLDITQSLLRHIGAAADQRPPKKFTGDRWLVIIVDGGFIETYRQVYEQLSIATDFKRILMVFGGGRVETLTG